MDNGSIASTIVQSKTVMFVMLVSAVVFTAEGFISQDITRNFQSAPACSETDVPKYLKLILHSSGARFGFAMGFIMMLLYYFLATSSGANSKFILVVMVTLPGILYFLVDGLATLQFTGKIKDNNTCKSEVEKSVYELGDLYFKYYFYKFVCIGLLLLITFLAYFSVG